MPDSFGARLRQRREERNVALSTIAEQTKIKASLLEALERDDLSRWPSGIYRRAYIRAYGQAIGLCPDTIVREFLEVHDDSPEVIPALQAMETAADRARSNVKSQARLRDIVGAAIGSLSRRRSVDEAPAATVASPVAPPPPEPDVETLVDPPSTSFSAAESILTVPPDQTVPPEPQFLLVETSPADDGEPVAADPPPGEAPDPGPEAIVPDVIAIAHVCTELGRVETADELQPLLQEVARILDASGVIVWVWDAIAEELSPALGHGYSPRVMAQLPTVRRDADNATAEAFRLSQICTVEGADGTPGALVVPMLTPWGCAGVLALELIHGNEHDGGLQAAARIVAAALAQLVGGARPAEVRSSGGPMAAPLEEIIPVLRVVR